MAKTYIRKTKNEYQLWINYGYGDGWEHEISEDTQKAIFERKAEYRANCPQYPVKIKTARIKIKYEVIKMSDLQVGQIFYDVSILDGKPFSKYILLQDKNPSGKSGSTGEDWYYNHGKVIGTYGYKNPYETPLLGGLHGIKDNFDVCIQVEVKEG